MSTDNDDILGVWELAAWEVEQGATWVSRGTNVKGLLIYTPSGHMSVTITSEAPGVDAPPNSAPPMIFYAGTYELRGDAMLHRAELSFDPVHFRDVRRRVELSHDTLVLRTPAEDRRQVRLTWKRTARLPA